VASTVDIVLRGKNEASQAIQQVKGNLGGLQGAAGGAGGALATLGKALPWLALAKFAEEAVSAVIALGQIGEESAQIEARFVGFTGGVQQADAAFRAMDDTLGNALTGNEKMQAATLLLGLGIAKTAQEAADLTKQALLMGISIQTLTQALETGRANGLVQYGFSLRDVAARAEVLMRANENLTLAEAKSLAIREQMVVKSDAIAAADGKMVTATDAMTKATDTLKDSLGDLVRKPYVAVVEVITKGIDKLDATVNSFSDPKAIDERNYAQAFTAYEKTVKRRMALEEQLARVMDGGSDMGVRLAEADLEVARANEAVALAAYKAAQGIQDINLYLEHTPEVSDAVSRALLDTAGAYDEVARAAGRARSATANEHFGLMTGESGLAPAEPIKGSKAWGEQETTRLRMDALRDIIAAQKTGNKVVAKDAASSWESAMNEAANRVQGKLSGAVSASLGLGALGGGDAFAPGSNGPFEAIFRAQSIAVHGTGGANEAMWAQQYGLTQESAKKIVTDFQSGLYSADVIKLIDVDALVGKIQGEQAAEESSKKFADFIAGKLGVKDAGALVASKTFQSIGGGVDADPTAQNDAAGKVVKAYSDSVTVELKKQPVISTLMGFGNTLWAHTETGMLDAASKSGVFQAAVAAAIAAYLASRAPSGANAVVNAGKAGGGALP
jgi:hypothetical protein